MITLLYGDETQVSSEGYVPYGWQFPDEKVAILSEKGHKINCFGLISRENEFHCTTSQENITSACIFEFLDDLSFKIRRETVVVLDNASVHKSKLIQQSLASWNQRGLFIFYLPTYSPKLNIAETVWRKLKGEWLRPEDYLDRDSLFYATNRCLANIGGILTIKFSDFNRN